MDHASNDDVIFDPTSIARCRELLGDEAEGLSDHEIDRIHRHADAMAHIIVELFLQQDDAQKELE